jgi:hypothetical protein
VNTVSASPNTAIRQVAGAISGGVPAILIALLSRLPAAWVGAVVMTGLVVLVVRRVATQRHGPIRDSVGVVVGIAVLTFVLSFLYAAVVSAVPG